MANCNVCKAEIAWYKGPSTAHKWQKRVPELEPDGTVKLERVKNGKDKKGRELWTRRAVASEVVHACGTPAPVPSKSDPMPEYDTVPESDILPQSEYEPNTGAWCSWRFLRGHQCSRPQGHTGDHIARGSNNPRLPELARAPQDAPAPAPVPQPEHKRDETPGYWDELDARVRATMKGILDEYGIEPPPTRIRVEVQGKSHESGQDEIVHPCVAELVSYIARRRHVYVHGPAGGGKTYGAEQACKLVGLDAAVITMPGMTYSKILGFKAADGSDTSSTLLDCFEFGKVAILDEFDRTLPAVAAALNSMLENGKYAIGKRIITKHADFCVIATGNTDLRGGTRVYTSAQPIDYATAARFAFVSWPYDQTHEQSLVRSILPPVPSKALVAWIRKMRANLTRDHIETVLCGPREAYRIAEDVSFGVAIERSAEAWIWRGLDRAVVDRLVRETPYPALAE